MRQMHKHCRASATKTVIDGKVLCAWEWVVGGGAGGVGMRESLSGLTRWQPPKMSICQWEMKRRPVGICYRRPRQPVGKISSKSLSVASLIHKKKKEIFRASWRQREAAGWKRTDLAVIWHGSWMALISALTQSVSSSLATSDRKPFYYYDNYD